MNQNREQMNIVIVGHVDHGKSTLIGRLLADTKSLPEGKLDAVKANCKRNAKPFEYAFLLDALKDEQSQGITIDTARCFFKSDKRDYIIIDAPGHIEFLKNMVSGAARAEAAMLVIDAKEGIRENSKRHGYMMSFLGIKNLAVCVNKMDLVNYDEKVFNAIKEEYTEFLKEINLKPLYFIPISAREGDCMVSASQNMPWYKGETVLSSLDEFKKAAPLTERELRFPVQDIYKFTDSKDDRRIVSGRIETGRVKVGDEVVFLPSNKRSKVKTIEGFNLPKQTDAFAGQSTGVTLETQIYIKPGEIMCRVGEKNSHVSNMFKANIFWMGKQPLVKNKNYKLKLATQQVPVVLKEIIGVLDASEISSIQNKTQVDRHDVAECVMEALKPVAFDEIANMASTGRFVLVDNYEIAGGGIILAPVFESETTLGKHIKNRNQHWEKGDVTQSSRANRFQHKSALVVLTGQTNTGKAAVAKALERKLFDLKKNVYYLGLSNQLLSAKESLTDKAISRIQHVQDLGEIAHIMTDSGMVLITTISDIDEYELEMLKNLNRPNPTVVVHFGEERFAKSNVNIKLTENPDSAKAAEEIAQYLNKELFLDPEFTI